MLHAGAYRGTMPRIEGVIVDGRTDHSCNADATAIGSSTRSNDMSLPSLADKFPSYIFARP
jgi:hypothetical protein